MSKTMQEWNCTVIDFKFIPLPQLKKKITVLKSPHVHKKAREQFEMCKKKSSIQIKTPSHKDALLIVFLINYSQFPGVEMKCHIKYHSSYTFLSSRHGKVNLAS